ncbi:MAG: AI-2E family transporter [Polyangiales bacterium]
MESVPPGAPESKRGRRIALSILLLLSFLTVARIVQPLWVGKAVGTMMAFTAQPTYRFLSRRFGERRALAAAITTLVTGVVWAVAGAISIYVITRELMARVAIMQPKLATGSLPDVIGERWLKLIERLGIHRDQVVPRLQEELSRATGWVASTAALILQTTGSAVLGLFIGLMTMYYVLIEWPSLPVRLERVLPLDPRHTRALVLEFRDVGRSAMVGTIATALVQGGLAGAGYAMVSLPQPVTWAVLTALASFLPLVGTALIYAPIGIYFIVDGHVGRGVFILIWGVLVVMAFADYVVRPRIVGGNSHGHPFLMLVAILGGIEVFGLPGLFVGPVLITMFVAILRIYERELTVGLIESPRTSISDRP